MKSTQIVRLLVIAAICLLAHRASAAGTVTITAPEDNATYAPDLYFDVTTSNTIQCGTLDNGNTISAQTTISVSYFPDVGDSYDYAGSPFESPVHTFTTMGDQTYNFNLVGLHVHDTGSFYFAATLEQQFNTDPWAWDDEAESYLTIAN